jgi:predicted aspartyl protease
MILETKDAGLRNLVIRSLFTVSLAFMSYFPYQSNADKLDFLRDAYDAKKLFDLRDAVLHGTAPDFYKAVLESSLNRTESAEKRIRSLLGTHLSSKDAYEAHDLLGNMYFRNGRYAQAYAEIVAALKANPDGSDAKQMLGITTALHTVPGMRVASIKPDSLRIEPGSIFLPVQLEGRAASLFFDTGASVSLLGESLALRLGLKPAGIQGRLNDASGRGVGNIKFTVANEFDIGALHLRNVPFVVIPDSGEPWVHLPVEKRGIIGLPVLLAMQTFRWSPKGSFVFGFPGHLLDAAHCNMLFSNSNPVIDVRVADRRLEFTLDTGAVDTDLNPAFAAALPGLVRDGKPEKRSLEGLGGSVEGDSVVLTSVSLGIGDRTAVLSPAHVLLKHGNGTWSAGNLGMDALRQTDSFTLDFRAMTLQLH